MGENSSIKICRLCLADNGTVPIFPEVESEKGCNNTDERIMFCAKIKASTIWFALAKLFAELMWV